jgi:hypothetical protein
VDAADAVVDDCVTGDDEDVEDDELEVLLDDLWLLPPHAAIATLAANAAAKMTHRPDLIPLIVGALPRLAVRSFFT